MLHSHIRERNNLEKTSEFPCLPKHERVKWEGTAFHKKAISSMVHKAFDKNQKYSIHVQVPRQLVSGKPKKDLNSRFIELCGGDDSDLVYISETSLLRKLLSVITTPSESKTKVVVLGMEQVDSELGSNVHVLHINSLSELSGHGDDIALVILSHMNHTTGKVLGVESISESIRSALPNTKIALDVSRTIGLQEIQFSKWGLDFLWSTSTSDNIAVSLISKSLDSVEWAGMEIDENRSRIISEFERTMNTPRIELSSIKDIVDQFRNDVSSKYTVSSDGDEYIITIIEKDDEKVCINHFEGLLNEVQVDLIKVQDAIEAKFEEE